ncbi:MAG: hypothetical protein ACP5HG_03500 [Anaerolineae bacterium]
MIERAREIAKMMGYESIDATLEAIGRGELILLKVPDEQRVEAAGWMHGQVPEIRAKNEELAQTLDDIASGLEMAMELTRYPADTDVCDMDLPHGWPSYCDKEVIR